MRFKLRQLQLFRETARRGSVSAAARALYVSQPAASQAIAATERQFGATLFDRAASGLTLTAAGALVDARIERAPEQLREGLPEARPSRATTTRGDPSNSAAPLQALVAI